MTWYRDDVLPVARARSSWWRRAVALFRRRRATPLALPVPALPVPAPPVPAVVCAHAGDRIPLYRVSIAAPVDHRCADCGASVAMPLRPFLRWPSGWRFDDERRMLVGPRGEEVTEETLVARDLGVFFADPP